MHRWPLPVETQEAVVPRVGCHPLEMEITVTKDETSYDPVLAALAPYSMQWRALDLRLPKDILAWDQINQIRGRIPRKLKVWNPNWSPMSPPIMAFLDAPQLREVDLAYSSLSLISLPWAQLNTIRCSLVGSHTLFIEILRIAASLEMLSISDWSFFRHAPPAPVPLDRLHTLKFEDLKRASSPRSFGSIHLSSAQKSLPCSVGLGIPSETGCIPHPINILCENTDVLFIEVKMVLMVWSPSEFCDLFLYIGRKDALPHLKTLAIEVSSGSTFPYKQLVNMLHGRWKDNSNE
ncbi:hypothetical protein FB451DRAFT_1174788 [Mycena latifolia]|nr:hypothetical protein FB451DRAFT_1174788 [Mycena latifolia]